MYVLQQKQQQSPLPSPSAMLCARQVRWLRPPLLTYITWGWRPFVGNRLLAYLPLACLTCVCPSHSVLSPSGLLVTKRRKWFSTSSTIVIVFIVFVYRIRVKLYLSKVSVLLWHTYTYVHAWIYLCAGTYVTIQLHLINRCINVHIQHLQCLTMIYCVGILENWHSWEVKF